LLATAQTPRESQAASQTVPVKGDIQDIDGQTLTVAVPQKIKVIGDDAQKKVDALSRGDTVLLTADKGEAQAASITKDNKTVPVSVQSRLLAGFIAFVLVVGVASLATGRSNNGKLAFGNPLSFCVGPNKQLADSNGVLVGRGSCRLFDDDFSARANQLGPSRGRRYSAESTCIFWSERAELRRRARDNRIEDQRSDCG
jgi:hypothetical protein